MPPPFESLSLPPEANVDDARRLYSQLSANSRTIVAKLINDWSVARATWDVPAPADHFVGFVIQFPDEEDVGPTQEFLHACQVPATVTFRK